MLGGSGFVGRHLSSLLVKQGWTVVVPTRNAARNRRLLVLPGVELVQADINDEGTLTRLVAGCDAAINLVGVLNDKAHDGSGFRTAHVELTEKLVRACLDQGVARLLQMSALKANAERGPSQYLKSKGQAEQALVNLAGEDLHYTIFQPSVIFGPEDKFINRFAQLLRLLPIIALPRLNARFAPVYVGDVATAFASALEQPTTHGRTYQLCGPAIYSLREILGLIERLLDIKRLVIELPDGLGRMQAWALEHLPGQLFTRDNFRSLAVASVCSEDGLEALGIRAHSLESTLPTYFTGDHHQHQLARLREGAGR
jgi:uncharacterized protein YbjT (DUF2867 family)